jgi:UDP-3-O-[3-hydroxymyristoyl] glucosamine N-acyltransferase
VDGITIGSRAVVGAGSGVMTDIPAGETWLGSPAALATDTTRMWAAQRRLFDTIRRVREVEKAVDRSPSPRP